MSQIKNSDEDVFSCLSASQIKAINLISEGKPLTDIALELNVSRKTLHRWQNIPDFQIALNQKKKELWDTIPERLRKLTYKSLIVIEEILSNESHPDRADAAIKFFKIIFSNKQNRICITPNGPTSRESYEQETQEAKLFGDLQQSIINTLI